MRRLVLLALLLLPATGGQDYYRSTITGIGGSPKIVAGGPPCRLTAQVAAVASVCTYTVGAADGSFDITATVTVITATAHNFLVTVNYTNENSVATSLTFDFAAPGAAFPSIIVNTSGAVSYGGFPIAIRAKTATTITVATSGTFTTVTYNVEATIRQTA